jgi:hypothetical protein
MDIPVRKNYTKLPLFDIIKLTLTWISSNVLKFIFPIIIGFVLIVILDNNIEKFKNNIFIMVIMAFENKLVCYIILYYFCINYFNKNINLLNILKILLVLILSTLFNYILLLLGNVKYTSIICFILDYICFNLFALCIINIIISNGFFGLKNGLLQIFNNKMFFLKLFIFNFIVEVILFALANIISYLFLKKPFQIKILQYMFFVFSCFWSIILIVFMNKKIQIVK